MNYYTHFSTKYTNFCDIYCIIGDVTVQCRPVGKLENALLSSNSFLGLFPSAVVECPQRGAEGLLVGDIEIEGSSKPMIIFFCSVF